MGKNQKKIKLNKTTLLLNKKFLIRSKALISNKRMCLHTYIYHTRHVSAISVCQVTDRIMEEPAGILSNCLG